MTNSEKKSKQAGNILRAATQLFARQGYHGTSTKEISRLADVAENTLFRYFERKEDLFWAVLRESLNGLELRLDLLRAMGEGANPETVLPLIFTQLVDITVLRPELLRLVAIAFIELPWKAYAVLYEHLSPLTSTLNEYLANCVANRKIREIDSSLATTAMITTAIGYPTLITLNAGTEIPYSDDREAVRAYSKFWLEMLAPPRLDSFRSAAAPRE